MKTEDAKALLDKYVDALMEHFESVEILITYRTEDGDNASVGLSRGGGNWYARLGSVMEYLERCKQDIRNSVSNESNI